MDHQNDLMDVLSLDAQAEVDRINGLISSEVKRWGARGVVLGLSGGLDSTVCAYCCARCLPPEQIHLFSLPERDSAAVPHQNARLVAEALHLPLEERNLSDFFREAGIYRNVPAQTAGNRPLLQRFIRLLRVLSGSPSFYAWGQDFAFGKRRGVLGWVLSRILWKKAAATKTFVFGKVRGRMLVLSILANQLDCLHICTTDRSEWSVGFYDPHGDGVGDIAPLQHLFKTQIRQVASALQIPEQVLRQPSSGDLAAGLPNEVAMGLSYEELDLILAGFSLGLDDETISIQSGLRRMLVAAVRSACRTADERRVLPVRLNPPHTENRINRPLRANKLADQ